MDYQTLNLLFKCNKQLVRKKMCVQKFSDTECMICSYISSHQNCSQDDVSVALKTDKTTVGKALISLEKKTCIVRTQDDKDRRTKRLSLTPLGQQKVKELVNLHNDRLAEILTCLSKDEQKQFENYCGRLLAYAEKLISDNRGNL